MQFALHVPYSKLCKDDLKMANCPKPVAKLKINIYYCICLKTETVCCFLVSIMLRCVVRLRIVQSVTYFRYISIHLRLTRYIPECGPTFCRT